jgi:hypothetical protein
MAQPYPRGLTIPDDREACVPCILDCLLVDVRVLGTHPREAPGTKYRTIDAQQRRRDPGDRGEDRRERHDERRMIRKRPHALRTEKGVTCIDGWYHKSPQFALCAHGRPSTTSFWSARSIFISEAA